MRGSPPLDIGGLAKSATVIGLVIGLLYRGLGATVILYQSGIAPWGTPGETTGNS